MRTITTEGYALLDALDAVPSGYYDGMSDPLYALECTGTLVVYWGGPTTRRQASRAVDTASRLLDDPDFPEVETEGLAWAELASALAPLEDYVADYVDGWDGPPQDVYGLAADGARQWLDANGLTGTVTVERGVWSKGPRVSVRLTR